MAIIEGTHALYVAQVAGRHSMRMFTQIGRRVPLHSTGVGKALLLPAARPGGAEHPAARPGMPAATDRTITDPEALLRELAAGRALGYVSEDGEQELGVSCVAVPVPGAPVLTAISFSGPGPRMTSDVVRRAATALQARGRRAGRPVHRARHRLTAAAAARRAPSGRSALIGRAAGRALRYPALAPLHPLTRRRWPLTVSQSGITIPLSPAERRGRARTAPTAASPISLPGELSQ